jgi:hypothetical protein
LQESSAKVGAAIAKFIEVVLGSTAVADGVEAVELAARLVFGEEGFLAPDEGDAGAHEREEKEGTRGTGGERGMRRGHDVGISCASACA